MSIVYILGEFPSYSENFILNEVIELQKKGLEIKIFAVQQGPKMEEKLREINGRAVYGKSIFSIYSLQAHLYLFTSFREKYFQGLKEIFSFSNESFSTILKKIKNFTISAQFLFNLKKDEISHLHAHFISLPGSIAFWMSQISSIPFSCSAHAHDIYTSGKSELNRKIDAAKFIITCTSYNKKYLDAMVGRRSRDKIIHIYHGIDLNQWPQRKRVGIVGNEIHILTIGRLVEKKGIIFLLDAVKLLRERGCKVKASVIGDGPLMTDFVKYIRKYNLSEIVHFFGALAQNSVKEIYQMSDIFVLPSVVTSSGDRDGLPNVLLEALTVGVPVISTAVSAISELIIDGRSGILVPEKDPEAIVNAVLKLQNDPEFYRYLSESGRKKVEREFAISASTDRLMQLLGNTQSCGEIQK